MNAFKKAFFADVGCVQICAHPETHAEGAARDDAALRAEAAEDADQVPGQAVEEVQHEDHERHLHQGQAQAQRRLGLRER